MTPLYYYCQCAPETVIDDCPSHTHYEQCLDDNTEQSPKRPYRRKRSGGGPNKMPTLMQVNGRRYYADKVAQGPQATISGDYPVRHRGQMLSHRRGLLTCCRGDFPMASWRRQTPVSRQSTFRSRYPTGLQLSQTPPKRSLGGSRGCALPLCDD